MPVYYFSFNNKFDKNISCLLYSNLVEFCFDYIWCLKTAENLIVDIDIFNEHYSGSCHHKYVKVYVFSL